MIVTLTSIVYGVNNFPHLSQDEKTFLHIAPATVEDLKSLFHKYAKSSSGFDFDITPYHNCQTYHVLNFATALFHFRWRVYKCDAIQCCLSVGDWAERKSLQ